MNFLYSELSDLTLLSSDQVDVLSINTILRRLSINDLMLDLADGFAPNIWECKWYNDSNVKGYPAGYAVWYNTESVPAFIRFNADRIYNYAKDNSYLKKKIKPFSNDQYQLYYSILTGYPYNSYGGKLLPLFDIGELSNAVLIKVSRIDNNKRPLSDKSAWKDFFSYTDSDYKTTINSLMKELENKHLLNFHMGHSTLASDINRYLTKDMSNIAGALRYTSHEFPTLTSGFDYVKLFVRLPITLRFVNSVKKSSTKYGHWQIKNYDKLVDKDGIITDAVKDGLFALLSGCNNYMSAGVDIVLNNMTDKMILNLTYRAIDETISPDESYKFDEIKDRINLYDCYFELLPLSCYLSSEISSCILNYEYVEREVVTKYPMMTYTFNKWFRYWNSGYLEHGGIVSTRDLNKVDIKFDWYYQKNGSTYLAPIYNYPKTRDSFYGVHTTLNGDNHIEHDSKNDISPILHYVVKLTPITSNLSSELFSYNDIDYQRRNSYGTYVGNEICELKNDGFSIIIDGASQALYYAYHVTGFKTNG